jgi:hypothetical protein
MTWEKKRVLVTVTAYPEKSKKYGQVVCTIGLTEEGDWISKLKRLSIRLYGLLQGENTRSRPP